MKESDAPPAVTSISIDVAPADLIDRITILEIKSERLTTESALQNVRLELTALRDVRERRFPSIPALDRLVGQLREVNQQLWELEEAVRRDEAAQDFGPDFIRSARGIMHSNDRRAALKQAINRMLSAGFLDEKSFPLPDPASDFRDDSAMLGETKRKR